MVARSQIARNWRTTAMAILGLFALAGCAAGVSNFATKRELLQPWTDLTGAQMNPASGALSTDFVMWQRPAAISVSGNGLYLIDAGLRRIFRYDRIGQTLTTLAPNLPVEPGMGLFAGEDQTVYITSPSSGNVLHFSWDGMSLPTLHSPGNLERPTAVVVDERGRRIVVVDELTGRLVVFNSLGVMLASIKPQKVQSIAAIATGPDGIYVADRLARRIVVLGWDGSFRYALGADFESEPGSIAVSRDNLVFVGDNFDDSIRVFQSRGARGGRLVGKIGGPAGGVTSFNGIAGLAVEGDMLFVSDSLNARIQVLMINPEAIEAETK